MFLPHTVLRGAFLALLLIMLILLLTWDKGAIEVCITGNPEKELEPGPKITSLDGKNAVQPMDEGKASDIKRILAKLDQRMPSVTFTDIKNTTNAKSSKAALVSPKDAYCVGEHLLVRLDLFDHTGKRKAHGGDFLRARIYSPGLKAAASGHIQDYKNGTYLVNFTLFWEGDVKVSLLLIHPSEAVSALWAARKKGYDKVTFTGKFLNGTSSALTECGFTMNTKAELCEYVDERDQQAFYCVKPEKVPCAAFISLKSKNAPISYLTDLERSLLNRSNIGVEIPQAFKDIRVVPCGSDLGFLGLSSHIAGTSPGCFQMGGRGHSLMPAEKKP